MPYDPKQHHRCSIRLDGYDYRCEGAYFVTVCTGERQCVFGSVDDDAVRLSQRGQVVQACWRDLPGHHPHVELDEYVVMPNHVHGILWLVADFDKRATQASPLQGGNPPVGATPASPSSRPAGPLPQSLGAIVGSFKSAVSRNINRLRPGAATNLWQPNYYEHIIRDQRGLAEVRDYIVLNPERWARDRENPASDGTDDFRAFIHSLECPPDAKKGDAGVAPTGGANV